MFHIVWVYSNWVSLIRLNKLVLVDKGLKFSPLIMCCSLPGHDIPQVELVINTTSTHSQPQPTATFDSQQRLSNAFLNFLEKHWASSSVNLDALCKF